ncbi:GNAT family N-acetyltransferase [Pararhizobium sp. YC-54]|uniref:GNAT family N-acetyltransferase n=1 Tax=Pararhizobium sp. YC-54 TaxID=2986920 RepID=UPI0021F7336D|nr:GNAT family N-acetyltransferase [Pararhizobium sp. YC-54]MCV9997986.1 GNAT family N-acetyltransferase [Pararhizobium sp. YC-54]
MIRHLGPGDLDIFRRIRLEALRTEPAAFASSAEDWEALPDAEWRRRLIANAVFVDFHEEEPVAIMALMRQGASKMAHRATVIMVYVRKGRRGGGHAKALLDAVIAHAREAGIRQLELAVSGENPAAIRFYQREGFAEAGRIAAGTIHEGREIEEILMLRRIDGVTATQ